MCREFGYEQFDGEKVSFLNIKLEELKVSKLYFLLTLSESSDLKNIPNTYRYESEKTVRRLKSVLVII